MLEKQIARQLLLKEGLAGVKIGKHVVPKQPIDVQLGEELSESLRALKVSEIDESLKTILANILF